MKTKMLLLALPLILAGCGSRSSADKTTQTTQLNYETYCNTKFDYCVDYPDFLIPQGEAGNQDGQKFISEDGKNQMWVYLAAKMNIVTGDSPTIQEAFEEDLQGKNVTEKQLHENYYTFSGKLQNNKLFAQYTISEMGSFFTLWFEYREEDAALFDTVIKHVSESFNVGVGEGQGGITTDDYKFTNFLMTFLDECWFNKNFNTLLRDNDKTLAKYIDPKMDIRRYFNPGSVSYLYTRSQKFGFDSSTDFSTQPDIEGGEYSVLTVPENKSYCELDFEKDGITVYYKPTGGVPNMVINNETLEMAPVKLPYPDAPIMIVFLPNKTGNPIGFYFIETPSGWKLAFVDDSLCGA